MDKPEHCLKDSPEWYQHVTCCHCGKPLSDNPLFDRANKLILLNSYAANKLIILAAMAQVREQIYLSQELRKVVKKLKEAQ